MKKNILFIGFLTLSLLPFKQAFACSCAQPGPPREEFQKADAVFSGQVIELKKSPDTYSWEAMFYVLEAWKGITTRTVTVSSVPSGGMCGYEFEKGEEYLVYGYKWDGDVLSTSLCTRTNKLTFAHEDLKELGRGVTELPDDATAPPIDDGAVHFQGRVYPYDRLIVLLLLLIGAPLLITIVFKNRKRIGEGVIFLKKHARGIIASILVVGVIGAVVYFVVDARWEKIHITRQQGNSWKSCDNLEQFINSAIQKANYCAKNEDCVVSDVGEPPCRCWSLANKEADLNHAPVLQALADYQKQECSRGIFCKPCGDPPIQAEIACQNNVCVNMYTEPKVRVENDKERYSVGDTIHVAVKGNHKDSVWIYERCDIPFSLMKQTAQGWEDGEAFPVEHCSYLPKEITSGQNLNYALLPQEVYGYGDLKVEPGTYRLKLYYFDSYQRSQHTFNTDLSGVIGPYYSYALSEMFYLGEENQ